MKRLAVTSLAAVLAAGAYIGGVSPADAQKTEIYNIGTAGIGGTFWPTGGVACSLMNKTRSKYGHNYRCVVESTAGSVGNLRSLRRGDLDLGLAQANLQYDAYRSLNVFKDEPPFKDLRFVMSFTTNMIQVVARADSGIKHFRDIKGKRMNTGNVGSGTEATSYMLLDAYGLDPDADLALDSKLTSREHAKGLCDNKYDAFLYPTAIGVASIHEAANNCDVNIAQVTGPELDKFLEDKPYFGKTVVPAGTYKGVDYDVHSFGYASTLNTTPKVPADFVYYLVKAIFDNFEEYKQQNVIFKNMTRESAWQFGKTVPYHEGAERYYKEVGFIK